MTTKMPYKVLCVCLGNICRSPTAEVVLRHYCEAQKLHIEIDSAGTSSDHSDQAPDLRSQKYALKRGYDLSRLKARQLKQQDFLDFDLILAMDFDNLKNIYALKSEAQKKHGNNLILAKVALMSEHDPLFEKQPLPDPYYGGDLGFDQVLDQCESSSKAWVEHFKRQFN